MNATASRIRRHQLILQLVRSQVISSQDDLASALGERGLDVTQSTLSRDLKELRVLRVPQKNGYRYLPAGEEASAPRGSASLSLSRIAAAEVAGVAANEVCVVLRTQAGRAPGVAAYLDQVGVADLLATVAGDDTVLVIPTSIDRCQALEAQLADLFELPPTDATSKLSSGRHQR
jgi:transcriptional regulator of arginine metabolism